MKQSNWILGLGILVALLLLVSTFIFKADTTDANRSTVVASPSEWVGQSLKSVFEKPVKDVSSLLFDFNN